MSSWDWCDVLGMSTNPGPVMKTDTLPPQKKWAHAQIFLKTNRRPILSL